MSQQFNATIVEITNVLKNNLNNVNKIILEKMDNKVELIPLIGNHIINSGGKRIRPILTILASKALDYKGDKDILIAACIEFIHTATLLHDDVVDESNSRRGVDTSNFIWGNKASILVGDYLFSKAFELMVETKSLTVLEILSNSSSIITQGEVLQLSNINNIDITFETYLDIITSKTASLFSAATKVAGVLADSNEKTLKNITDYGINLGILFQIIDDILDYHGTQSTGKPIGADLREGKITLPILLVLKECTSEERKELNRIFVDLQQNDNDINFVLTLIKKYNSITKSINIANEYLEKGLENLSNINNNNQYTELLANLLKNSISRIN